MLIETTIIAILLPTSMAGQVPFFSKKYRVIAADSRAQGRSADPSDSLSYEMMADDMAARVEHEREFRLGHAPSGVLADADRLTVGHDLLWQRFEEDLRAWCGVNAVVGIGAEGRFLHARRLAPQIGHPCRPDLLVVHWRAETDLAKRQPGQITFGEVPETLTPGLVIQKWLELSDACGSQISHHGVLVHQTDADLVVASLKSADVHAPIVATKEAAPRVEMSLGRHVHVRAMASGRARGSRPEWPAPDLGHGAGTLSQQPSAVGGERKRPLTKQTPRSFDVIPASPTVANEVQESCQDRS